MNMLLRFLALLLPAAANLVKVSTLTQGGWKKVTMSADGAKIAATTNDSGSYGKVWVSTDGGTNFATTTKDASDVVMSKDGSKMASIITGTAGKISLSSDDGATWAESGSASLTWQAMALSNDGSKMAAAVKDGNIFISSDTGATWTDTGVGPQNWISIAMSADGTKIAAAIDGGKIWTSSDSGSAWTESAGSVSQRWTGVALSDDGTKMAACSHQQGVYYSHDSGATWTISSLVADHRLYKSIAVSADGQMVVTMSCCRDVVWISEDAGLTYTMEHAVNFYWESIAISADGLKIVASASEDSGGLWLKTITVTSTTTMTATGGGAFSGARALATAMLPSVLILIGALRCHPV